MMVWWTENLKHCLDFKGCHDFFLLSIVYTEQIILPEVKLSGIANLW